MYICVFIVANKILLSLYIYFQICRKDTEAVRINDFMSPCSGRLILRP